MIYGFNNISNKPILSDFNESDELIGGIHYDVSISDLQDKSLKSCTWDEDTQILTLKFENELIQQDLDKLTNIIQNYR